MEKRFTTTDVYLATFLVISKIPIEFEVRNGRVIFSFPASDDLYKLTYSYNCGNATVSVVEFANMLKYVRARMNDIKTGAVRL